MLNSLKYVKTIYRRMAKSSDLSPTNVKKFFEKVFLIQSLDAHDGTFLPPEKNVNSYL